MDQAPPSRPTPADLAKKYQPQQLTQWFYERQLWQARLSPDAKQLVATGYDATIQRWAVSRLPDAAPTKETPEPAPKKGKKAKDSKPTAPLKFSAMPPLRAHDGWAQGLAFHPTESLLYSSDSWGRLCCWPLNAGDDVQPTWQHVEAHARWIRDLAVSPDGRWLASCGDAGIVKIWDARNGQLKQTLEGHRENVFCVRFHPTEPLLLTGDLPGRVRVFDPVGGKLVRELDAAWLYQHHRIQHCGGVRCLAISPDGQDVVCGGQKTPVGAFANGTPGLVHFEFKTGKQQKQLAIGADGDGFIYDLQFHPDGFLVGVSCAFPGKGHLWLWQPGGEKPFLQSKLFPNGRSLAQHPDGNLITVLASDSPNANGRPLKEGKYIGGRSKLQLIRLGA